MELFFPSTSTLFNIHQYSHIPFFLNNSNIQMSYSNKFYAYYHARNHQPFDMVLISVRCKAYMTNMENNTAT